MQLRGICVDKIANNCMSIHVYSTFHYFSCLVSAFKIRVVLSRFCVIISESTELYLYIKILRDKENGDENLSNF
jgi:hypothetical protein